MCYQLDEDKLEDLYRASFDDYIVQPLIGIIRGATCSKKFRFNFTYGGAPITFPFIQDDVIERFWQEFPGKMLNDIIYYGVVVFALEERAGLGPQGESVVVPRLLQPTDYVLRWTNDYGRREFRVYKRPHARDIEAIHERLRDETIAAREALSKMEPSVRAAMEAYYLKGATFWNKHAPPKGWESVAPAFDPFTVDLAEARERGFIFTTQRIGEMLFEGNVGCRQTGHLITRTRGKFLEFWPDCYPIFFGAEPSNCGAVNSVFSRILPLLRSHAGLWDDICKASASLANPQRYILRHDAKRQRTDERGMPLPPFVDPAGNREFPPSRNGKEVQDAFRTLIERGYIPPPSPNDPYGLGRGPSARRPDLDCPVVVDGIRSLPEGMNLHEPAASVLGQQKDFLELLYMLITISLGVSRAYIRGATDRRSSGDAQVAEAVLKDTAETVQSHIARAVESLARGVFGKQILDHITEEEIRSQEEAFYSRWYKEAIKPDRSVYSTECYPMALDDSYPQMDPSEENASKFAPQTSSSSSSPHLFDSTSSCSHNNNNNNNNINSYHGNNDNDADAASPHHASYASENMHGIEADEIGDVRARDGALDATFHTEYGTHKKARPIQLRSQEARLGVSHQRSGSFDKARNLRDESVRDDSDAREGEEGKESRDAEKKMAMYPRIVVNDYEQSMTKGWPLSDPEGYKPRSRLLHSMESLRPFGSAALKNPRTGKKDSRLGRSGKSLASRKSKNGSDSNSGGDSGDSDEEGNSEDEEQDETLRENEDDGGDEEEEDASNDSLSRENFDDDDNDDGADDYDDNHDDAVVGGGGSDEYDNDDDYDDDSQEAETRNNAQHEDEMELEAKEHFTPRSGRNEKPKKKSLRPVIHYYSAKFAPNYEKDSDEEGGGGGGEEVEQDNAREEEIPNNTSDGAKIPPHNHKTPLQRRDNMLLVEVEASKGSKNRRGIMKNKRASNASRDSSVKRDKKTGRFLKRTSNKKPGKARTGKNKVTRKSKKRQRSPIRNTDQEYDESNSEEGEGGEESSHEEQEIPIIELYDGSGEEIDICSEGDNESSNECETLFEEASGNGEEEEQEEQDGSSSQNCIELSSPDDNAENNNDGDSSNNISGDDTSAIDEPDERQHCEESEGDHSELETPQSDKNGTIFIRNASSDSDDDFDGNVQDVITEDCALLEDPSSCNEGKEEEQEEQEEQEDQSQPSDDDEDMDNSDVRSDDSLEDTVDLTEEAYDSEMPEQCNVQSLSESDVENDDDDGDSNVSDNNSCSPQFQGIRVKQEKKHDPSDLPNHTLPVSPLPLQMPIFAITDEQRLNLKRQIAAKLKVVVTFDNNPLRTMGNFVFLRKNRIMDRKKADEEILGLFGYTPEFACKKGEKRKEAPQAIRDARSSVFSKRHSNASEPSPSKRSVARRSRKGNRSFSSVSSEEEEEEEKECEGSEDGQENENDGDDQKHQKYSRYGSMKQDKNESTGKNDMIYGEGGDSAEMECSGEEESEDSDAKNAARIDSKRSKTNKKYEYRGDDPKRKTPRNNSKNSQRLFSDSGANEEEKKTKKKKKGKRHISNRFKLKKRFPFRTSVGGMINFKNKKNKMMVK